MVAVKGTASATPVPVTQRGPTRWSRSAARARLPAPPVNLRQLVIASAGTIAPVTWRQGIGTKRARSAAAVQLCVGLVKNVTASPFAAILLSGMLATVRFKEGGAWNS